MESLLGDDEKRAANGGILAVYQSYPYRWVTMSLFVLAGFANALVLLTWSPISDKAQTYWGGINITAINLLATAFQICYIPGTFLALHLTSKYGLRAALLLGSMLTGVGCVVRFIGVEIHGQASDTISYVVVFLGTALVALAQPVYLNMPAKVASVWFPLNQRDLAAIIHSLSQPLGSAIGSALPGVLVTGESVSEISKGISLLVLLQMIISMVSFVAVYFLFRERPPLPPSLTAEKSDLEDESGPSIFAYFYDLLSSVNYVKLLIAFTIILGNLNAVATLLNQLPASYSGGEIGFTGAALIMAGFCLSLLAGYVLDCSKSYKLVLCILYILTFLSWTFFMASCRDGVFPLFIFSAACLGGTTLPAGKLILYILFYLSSLFSPV